VTSGARTCTVSGLKNKTSYRFLVSARNTIGSSPESGWSSAVVAGTPTAPRGLTVAFPHPDGATASWQAPAFTGSGPVSSYEARWSADGGHSWSAWTSTNLHRRAGRAGLTKGDTYLVEVRARNHSGAGLIATRTFTQSR